VPQGCLVGAGWLGIARKRSVGGGCTTKLLLTGAACAAPESFARESGV